MKDIKLLIYLLDYLKEYLPFERFKRFSEKDKEVYAFIRLYQKLGGEIIEVDGFMSISESFEITLRLLNGEKIVLKEKEKRKRTVCVSPYTINSRSYIVSGLTAAALSAKSVTVEDKNLYPGYADKIGYKNQKQKRTGSNIPKQNMKRRR